MPWTLTRFGSGSEGRDSFTKVAWACLEKDPGRWDGQGAQPRHLVASIVREKSEVSLEGRAEFKEEFQVRAKRASVLTDVCFGEVRQCAVS